jgi:DNA-binding NarL/FixJ family response regulator
MPDVVITDVMMPRCDGYGLLKRLRADERLGGTPVIFLTAKGMTADRIAGFQAGADDYIPKPFDPDELVARVRNVVRRQERLLAEAARFADADIGAMARQITEIRSMLGGGGGSGTGSGGSARKPVSDVKLDFTPREASVLQLVAEGMMNKEIARRLETSIRNVEKYVSRLFIKTGTASRTELVRFALEHGLVD